MYTYRENVILHKWTALNLLFWYREVDKAIRSTTFIVIFIYLTFKNWKASHMDIFTLSSIIISLLLNQFWSGKAHTMKKYLCYKLVVIHFIRLTANWLEGRTIKYTNFPAKYTNSRPKLHCNIHVVLCLVSVTWNKRWGIGIPELHDHAERHSAFNTSSKWILLILIFMIFFRYFSY